MSLELKSLRSMRTMPLPHTPRVEGYGKEHVGAAHDIRLFPAAVRQKAAVQADAVL